MLIIIISRSSLKLGHIGSKTRSLGQQATQMRDLGPLWPSCFGHRHFYRDKLVNEISEEPHRILIFGMLVLAKVQCID